MRNPAAARLPALLAAALFLAALAPAAVAAPPQPAADPAAVLAARPFVEELRKFEHDLDEIERSIFVAAAAKSGSALQKDMERRFSELSSLARRLQQTVAISPLRREVNLVEPVTRLNSVFTRLAQGKERPTRGLSLRRTSTAEFNRLKRSEIVKIRKSEGSEEEKAAAIEDLYDEWLSTVKNDNLKRFGRLSSLNLRAPYEDSALALFDLRHMIRELRRKRPKPVTPPEAETPPPPKREKTRPTQR